VSDSSRLEGIDVGRAIAIATVVHAHVRAFHGPEWAGTLPAAVSEWLALVGRVAVPFFFVTSGYFFGRKLAKGGDPAALFRRSARRILWLYVVWSAAYLVLPALASGLHHLSPAAAEATLAARLRWGLARPVTFLLQGPQEHLWFLPAVVLGLGVVAGTRARAWSATAPVAIGLAFYAVALAGGSYTAPLGIHLAFNPRNGPFVATLFVGTGALLAERESRIGRAWASARAGWLLFLGGLALCVVEALALRPWGRDPGSHDALLGLVLAGPGFFLVARHSPLAAPAWLSGLGRLTLGIYAAHVLVALPVSHLAARLVGATGEISAPVLVFLGTAALALALSRSPRLRPLVA